MSNHALLTDRPALLRHRLRAMGMAEPADFLHRHVADIVQERLDEVNRPFTSPVVITSMPHVFDDILPSVLSVPDADTLPLTENSHDLVVHSLALHWANDPVGQMVQARRALSPDGMLLVACFGGQTLSELRASLAEAETQVSNGLSPRVAPMGEIRDLGALLQRAGLALPVADSITLTVEYDTAFHLMRDLRAMGETNALTARLRHPTKRAVLTTAAQIYADSYTRPSGRVAATFEIVFLTGWAPSDTQQQPLRPGSAATRLADALETHEQPAGDKVDRRSD